MQSIGGIVLPKGGRNSPLAHNTGIDQVGVLLGKDDQVQSFAMFGRCLEQPPQGIRVVGRTKSPVVGTPSNAAKDGNAVRLLRKGRPGELVFGRIGAAGTVVPLLLEAVDFIVPPCHFVKIGNGKKASRGTVAKTPVGLVSMVIAGSFRHKVTLTNSQRHVKGKRATGG